MCVGGLPRVFIETAWMRLVQRGQASRGSLSAFRNPQSGSGPRVARWASMQRTSQPADLTIADDNPAILVVDDDEDSRRILTYGLGSAGYRVLLADNGAAAVEICRHLLPSLVIMDLAMPEMDGYTATKTLKSDERTRSVPVIAWSARVALADAADLLTSGFEEVLPKPSLPKDVIDAVKRRVPVGSAAPRAD